MLAPTYLVVDPAHFEVAYAINPWMQPDSWSNDPAGMRDRSLTGFGALTHAIQAIGGRVEILPGVVGAPDLVFPANAGVVLDGRAVVARFAHPERQVEEPVFLAAFKCLERRGLLNEVALLPEEVFQEGAGDFIWDASRQLFWAGYGQRSTIEGARAVEDFFGEMTVMLELATPHFYHLDTCFCPLPGGEIFFYPKAFSAQTVDKIRAIVPPHQLIEATDEDAARFCVNAVALGKHVIMAQPAPHLRETLRERGYKVIGVDLAPYILSGGGAYCMTLRLDRVSNRARRVAAAE